MKGNRELMKYNISFEEKPELRTLKLLFYIYTFMIFALYIMPQYFGIHIGVDITTTRAANIVIFLYMLFSPKIFTHFCKTCTRCVILLPLSLYLCVALYTMVFRTDINAFFLVFIEILTLFMNIYGIRYVIGYRRAVKWSIYCAYFLSVYGLIEFVYGKSIFLQFLSTVPNGVVNSYRSGHYRIMGPCGHSLAYGLLLLLFIAIACIDLEKNELFLFRRPVLIILLYVNVFLTGSRSTLGIAVIEALAIIFFSNRRNVKKTLLLLCTFIVGIAFFLMLFYNTSIGQYMLGQIMSVVDQALGTNYAINFGVDVETLKNSAEYREALPYVFTLDWLNPLVGRGSNFGGAEINGIYVHSIDNYYVLQYIKYAYPGMIAYILFMLTMLIVLIMDIKERKTAVSKAILIGAVFYFVNLWWVDALQTLKFVYVLFAIFYAGRLESKDIEMNRSVKLHKK